MQDETVFLIFDGAMILISISCLTIIHPQFFFPFLSKGVDKKISAGVPPAESNDYEMRSAPQSRQGAGFP
ncbi:RTA1 domain-containing protein [Candidatus Bathyarchaeota archaeon]|nr:RTA1 domain-containing protein [Candidatus Bathyarchaeota archaeon]